MRQLTSLDAQFLALENSRQSGHVAGLAILDPSTATGGRVGCAEITELLRTRLPLLPPLRWRLAAGAARARLSLLGRRRRLRPRLPRARAGAGRAGHRRPAGRAGGADHLAPARPRAPAVGALRDRRARERPRRGADEDPPRGDRRPVAARRSWACCSTSRPRAASCRPSRARRRPATTRGSWRCSGRGLLGVPRYPVRMLRALPSRAAEPRGHAVRRAARGRAR